jgi:hypothetical protein
MSKQREAKLLSKIEALVNGVKVWDNTKARHYSQTAIQCLNDHYPHTKRDPLNCGACALAMGDETGPNYSGWARIYVEAGKHVPKKWHTAFLLELHRTDNMPYVEALKKSIKTFGVIL